MNRFIKIFILLVIFAIFAIVLGTEAVEALRDAAAPPPLPYGLAMAGD